LVFLFAALISGGDFLASAQTVQQKTHGQNSPAAYTGKGNITVNINELKEIERIVQEAIKSYETGKDVERDELKKRIAEIHKTQFNVLPQEADQWAEQFVSTLPLRKDRVIAEENEETKRFEKHRMNIPILFEYCIKKFDEYILALKKHDKKIDFKQEQIPEIITFANSSQEYNSLRVASFPNGTVLKLSFWTGVIKNDRFQTYPFLRIYLIKNGVEQIMLQVVQEQIAGFINALAYIWYGKHKDGELTDDFKKRLTKAYDIIIQEAYLRSPEAPARRVKTVP
jgi:hypothetical protein